MSYLNDITIFVQAEESTHAAQPDKEYLPITGLPEFTKNAAKLAYSTESKPFAENRVCIILHDKLPCTQTF